MPHTGGDSGGARGGPDRYEPLPSLPGIPAYLWRKLSPRGRRVAAVAGALLLVAAVAGVVFGAPAIDRSKRDREAREAAEVAARRAARDRRLAVEQRPRTGHGPAAAGLPPARALEARRALVARLAAAIERDARARRPGAPPGRRVRDVGCERFPRSIGERDPAELLDAPTGRYACLAVTAVVPPGGTTVGSSVGYPYRARVDFADGAYTFCKVSGRPGEKAIPSRSAVTVPRACGGGP
jgi:hypothetical protein